jgi:hypothetical protein
LVRFGVGIINILRGDKFFFHFFEKFLNGLGGPFVYVWFVLADLVADFVLDNAFRLSERTRSLRLDESRPAGTPGRDVSPVLYIKYASLPHASFETGNILFPG